jgi:hypothetical protein
MENIDANEKSSFEEEEQDIDPFHELFHKEEEMTRLEASSTDIASLNLAPDVAKKARELNKHAPSVRFTSGRRDIAKQARAMANNIVHNRKWIEQTYRSTAAIRALQQWVDAHPSADTNEIATGLAQVMKGMPSAQQMGISRHLSGRAFDVQPNSCPESAIWALSPRTFLQKEGGLVIWHVDF